VTWPTNITTTRLIEYIVAIVGNTVKGIININYKAIMEVLIVTDLEILVVLITRLLKRDLNRLVNGMEPVELWDEG
jgi:hypothetical protein